LEQALNANKNCVRANVLLGDIEAEANEHKAAISTWKRIEFQKPEYLGLIAPKLLASYRALNQTAEGLSLLQTYLQTYQLTSLLNVLYEATMQEQGAESAAKLARTELIKMPSLTTLDQLLQHVRFWKRSSLKMATFRTHNSCNRLCVMQSATKWLITVCSVVLKPNIITGNARHVMPGKPFQQNLPLFKI